MTAISDTQDDRKTGLKRLWLPAVLCLALLGLETCALFYGLGQSPGIGRAGRPPVALLIEGAGEVRSKEAGVLAWRAAVSGDRYFERDTIATMASSNATVQFTDGSLMEVEAGSLVVLEKAPGPGSPLELKLSDGAFIRRKAGKGTVIVKSGGQKVTLEDKGGNAVFRLRAPTNSSEGLELTVESGVLSVDGREDVGPSERARLKAGGLMEREPRDPLNPVRLAPPKLKRPRVRMETRHTVGSADVMRVSAVGKPAAPRVTAELEWESVSDAKSYRLQIAHDEVFQNLILDQEIDVTSYLYETVAEPGARTLYFRAASRNSGGELGDFGPGESFEIPAAPVPPPAPAPPPPPKIAPRVSRRAESENREKPAPVAPAPKTEEARRFHWSIATGAAYRSRGFKIMNGSPALDANGITLISAAAEGRYRIIENGWLRTRLTVMPEKLELKNKALVDDGLNVPSTAFSVAYLHDLGPLAVGGGGFMATTQRITLTGSKVRAEGVKALGPELQLSTGIARGDTLYGTVRLGYALVGSSGLEAAALARIPLLWGTFLEGEGQWRSWEHESSYGLSVRLGYGR